MALCRKLFRTLTLTERERAYLRFMNSSKLPKPSKKNDSNNVFQSGLFFSIADSKYFAIRSMSSTHIEDLINDPRRNLSYEDLMESKLDGPILLIDVREPGELIETGAIPDSINIPLPELDDGLGNMSPEAFKKTYGTDKPAKSMFLVFSCRSGRRSSLALGKALQLGYLNSAHYTGGWLDWEKHLPKEH